MPRFHLRHEWRSFSLGFDKKTASGDDFLKINPKGAVATLALDNGQVLTENAVILQYLADSNHASNLLPGVNDFKRYRILEWLNYISTELHKTIGALFNTGFSDDIKDMFKSMIKTKCNFVNHHLALDSYICGEVFTLPDAYLFVMFTWLIHFKFDLNEWPHIHRYFNELKKRPSIQQSLLEEKLEF